MGDKLFSRIERHQGAQPWGSVLDAGAGEHSMRWLAGLSASSLTGVTAANWMALKVRQGLGALLRPEDRLVIGNWTDPGLLEGEVFDTVVADYLLGAIDGFAPYFQDQLFARLRPHVGQRLYVVGMAPFPDQSADPGGQLILDIARLRDACILHAGHRCYREYPRDWVERSLAGAGFKVEAAWSLPIVFRERFVNGQLDVCERKLPLIDDMILREALGAHIRALRERALRWLEAHPGGVQLGEDWIVAAQPV